MTNIVERLKLLRHRDSTRQNYYTIWKIFSRFCLKLDHCPSTWHERLSLFVGYLVEDGKQSSTVKSYISAIKNVLRDDGIKIKEDQYLLTSLTKACKLMNDSVCVRLPIQKTLLSNLIAKIKSQYDEIGQPYLGLMYQTLISTAYFGLFRVGELTSGSHPVKACDVFIGDNKPKMLFVLRSSKTLTEGSTPQMIKISSTAQFTGQNFCPYKLLREYSEGKRPVFD